MQSTKQHWLRERQLLSISGEKKHRLERSFISEFTNPAATCTQHEAVLLARPVCKAKAGQNVTPIVLPLSSTSFSRRGPALGENAIWHDSRRLGLQDQHSQALQTSLCSSHRKGLCLDHTRLFLLCHSTATCRHCPAFAWQSSAAAACGLAQLPQAQ